MLRFQVLLGVKLRTVIDYRCFEVTQPTAFILERWRALERVEEFWLLQDSSSLDDEGGTFLRNVGDN
jgi:hypothetical protein